MIAEIGHFALILAGVIALTQVGLLSRALYGGTQHLSPAQPAYKAGVRCSALQAMLCALAFIMLGTGYLTSDFSTLNVVLNSHTLKPVLYKFSGVWGNHEGSLLLWILMLTGFGALLARYPARLAPDMRAAALATQAALSLAFIAFIVATSNPFLRIDPAPVEGQGLNPILQDPALAVHPPLLYAGYVGFSTVFSMAVAGLVTGRIDRSWARATRPFALLAWTCLSAGIALGSFWAYYELGWGGWWFWDPVENAALLPWLTGTALIHSLSVLEKRGHLPRWCALLAILTFSLSLLGTFLVRSGVLTSVHSFAVDPERGLVILAMLAGFTGAALLLYALRAPRATAESYIGTPVPALSRESGLILNNLLLCVIAATVLLGTLYPILLDALGLEGIAVGPPYFHLSVIPVAVPLIALMAVAPFTPWTGLPGATLLNRLQRPLLLTIILTLATALLAVAAGPAAIAGLALAFWMISAALVYGWRRLGPDLLAGPWQMITRMRVAPLSHLALSLSHAGLGVAVVGMIGLGLLETEKIIRLAPGEGSAIGPFYAELANPESQWEQNYRSTAAEILIYRTKAQSEDGSNPVIRLAPEKRFYPVSGTLTTEAGIHTGPLATTYVTISRPGENETGDWIVHLRYQPLAAFLWTGFSLLVFGGIFATLAAFAHAARMKEDAQDQPDAITSEAGASA